MAITINETLVSKSIYNYSHTEHIQGHTQDRNKNECIRRESLIARLLTVTEGSQKTQDNNGNGIQNIPPDMPIDFCHGPINLVMNKKLYF